VVGENTKPQAAFFQYYNHGHHKNHYNHCTDGLGKCGCTVVVGDVPKCRDDSAHRNNHIQPAGLREASSFQNNNLCFAAANINPINLVPTAGKGKELWLVMVLPNRIRDRSPKQPQPAFFQK